MKPRRLLWSLWLVALVFFIGNLLLPISTGRTRLGGVGLLAAVWFGLIILCWHRSALRWLLLGLTVALAGWLLSPARSLPPASELRAEYVAGLRRYEGVRYFWGGESCFGIDCSGLTRRGLIDGLIWRGVRTFDAGLIRRAVVLWWYDTTANQLGEGYAGLTQAVLEAPSLNSLVDPRVQPGDLAVTGDGVHILAYCGDHEWIEADPIVERVLRVKAPSSDSVWFDVPMKIVRWRLLSGGD